MFSGEERWGGTPSYGEFDETRHLRQGRRVSAVRDTAAMIAGMAPVLQPGRFVFCTTDDPQLAARAMADAVAMYRESAGVSLVLPEKAADLHGFETTLPMACITLSVQSSLEGIGLTATVSAALTEAGIPCNMVAAFHHDHVFVPEDRAAEAVAVLRERAKAG